MTTIELNELKDRIHGNNQRWWSDLTTGEPIKRDRRELLMLTVSEVSEGMEGVRKNLKDDKLVHREMIEVEMADAYIRLLDLAGGFGIELEVRDFTFDVPNNVAAALFNLVKMIVLCEDPSLDYRISTTLGYIRCFCEVKGYDLHGALEEKLTFNKSRLDHTREARLAENGKRF